MSYEKLMTLWQEMCKCNSVNNVLASSLYFHSLLGAYFNKKIINWGVSGKDLRINVVWLQASRTGKDQLNKVLEIVAKEIGLSVVNETDISGDSALIGSYDSNKNDYNIKNGLSESEPIKETKKGEILTYKNPIIVGDLGLYDIIIIGEGKLLFQTSSEKVLTTLQPALDYPAKIRKKMKSEKAIEYECKCTLVITSIPFAQMKRSIVDQGFFQRTVLYIRRLDIDAIRSMREKAVDLRSEIYEKTFKESLEIFKNEIKEFSRNESKVFVGEKAGKKLIDLQNDFIDIIKERIRGQEAINALSFTQTAQDTAIRIGAQIALLDKREEITPEDIEKAYFPVNGFIKTIVNELEVEVDKDEQRQLLEYYKVIKRVFTELEGIDKIPITSLTKLLSTKCNMGIATSRRKVEDLINQGFLIKEHGEKHTLYIKIIKQEDEQNGKNN